MVHYTLTYFDLRGRAESIRQVFAYAGVPFDDVRVPRDKWTEIKPQTPLGQLPVLAVDGAPIGQSVTILRFLGRQFGMTGKTPLEAARLDMIIDCLQEFYEEIKPFMATQLGFGKGDRQQLHSNVFVPNRDKYLALLAKNIHGDFILDNDVTWADIHRANSLDLLSSIPGALDGFPSLRAHVERVHSLPRLKAYLAARPDAPY